MNANKIKRMVEMGRAYFQQKRRCEVWSTQIKQWCPISEVNEGVLFKPSKKTRVAPAKVAFV